MDHGSFHCRGFGMDLVKQRYVGMDLVNQRYVGMDLGSPHSVDVALGSPHSDGMDLGSQRCDDMGPEEPIPVGRTVRRSHRNLAGGSAGFPSAAEI